MFITYFNWYQESYTSQNKGILLAGSIHRYQTHCTGFKALGEKPELASISF